MEHSQSDQDRRQALHIDETSRQVKTTAARNCLAEFLHESVWPGLGLLGESYVLFSIGTLKPIWQLLFPQCFVEKVNQEEEEEVCSTEILNPLTYAVVLGVICGMLLLGYLANRIGRRRGSITTASLMVFGSVGLMGASLFLAKYPVALFRVCTVSLAIFGVGVGGEYPLSAASASEKAMEELKCREEKDGLMQIPEDGEELPVVKHNKQAQRGRKILLVFTMQGVGIFVNSILLTMLFWMFRQGSVVIDSDAEVSSQTRAALLSIWRIAYAVGTIILVLVLYTRIRFLKESAVWEHDKKCRDDLPRNNNNNNLTSLPPVATEEQNLPLSPTLSMVSSVSSLSAPSVAILPASSSDHMLLQSVPSTDPVEDLKAATWQLIARNYGVRLLGSSLCWMLWDVAFYGNKLFQSSFLLALTGDETTLFEFSLAATLNAGVALLGYFGAAFLVDKAGRRSLQQWGFLGTGALFVGCGFLYQDLSSASLVAMYLGSSFLGQLGPNATTFLVPAEIFPTEVRTTCHGIAAASGKVGALLAAVAFSYVEEIDMFLLSGYASFAACAVTFWTIPETLGLDLYEIDRKWRLTQDGRKGEYHGDANHPRFLSYYERNRVALQQKQQQSDFYAMAD